MMKNLTIFSALGLTNAAGGSGWDYSQNGDDWGINVNADCLLSNQSPINLSTEKGPEFQTYTKMSASDDMFIKKYNNVHDVKQKFTGFTTKVAIDDTGVRNGFAKKVSGSYQNAYYMGPTEFDALQFHFHTGSEHTVDGYRYDFEMHTVHVPTDSEVKDGIGYAAVGIIFDTKYYTAKLSWGEQKVIDNFFDSLKMDEVTGEPKVDVLNYGTLLNMVDTDNRWTYKGSVTTPPCGRFVHWNVLRTVYPISEKHLNQYKAQLKRNTIQSPPLETTGNWRAIQAVDYHAVAYVSSEKKQSKYHYVQDQSGEIYMLEGEGAEGWLNEQEAKRFEMEETKKYQYEVKPMVDPAEANKPRSPRTITVPQFSMGSMSNILGDAVTIKAAVSFAVSASIVLSTI